MQKSAGVQVMSLTGNEPFVLSGKNIGRTTLDFWRWSMSELNDNLIRASLGEFVVASALGDRCVDQQRAGWRVYDLLTDYGCKIEVKTSARRQTWKQKRPSTQIFDIAQKVDWRNRGDAIRHSDVFVFCVLNNDDPEDSLLDLSIWEFYVVLTADIDATLGAQKQITLSSIRKHLPFTATGFAGLSMAICQTFLRVADGTE